MIVYEKDSRNYSKVYAIAYGEDGKKRRYWTDRGYVGASSCDVVEISNLVEKNVFEYQGFKYESEDEKIDGWYLIKEWGDDFLNEEEKVKFLKQKEKVEKLLPEIFERVEIDYVKWKVRNGLLEEWSNNFGNKIIEISDTERFIEDDKYSIYYDINNLDEIEVIKK